MKTAAGMLGRSCLIGAATGLRSQCGPAAVSWTTPPGAKDPLARPWVRAATLSAAAGELVADKSPRIPSRLAATGLVPRLVLGAVTAVLLSRRSQAGGSAVLAGAVGASAAFAAAHAGSRWRQVAEGRTGTDAVGAVLEDVTALSLAWAACAPAGCRP